MRILIVNSSGSRWTLAHSYSHAFRQLGHESSLLDLLYKTEKESSSPQSSLRWNFPWLQKIPRRISRIAWNTAGKTSQKTMAAIDERQPDLILVVGSVEIPQEILSEIKKKLPECRVLWYLTDPLAVQNDLLVKSMPVYDSVLTFSKFQVPLLYWFGAKKVFYLPFGYDPQIHKRMALTSPEEKFYGSDVAYLGTWQPHIEFWLKKLCSYNLKIWGNQWYRVKSEADLMRCWQGEGVGLYDELAKVVCASKIIFNMVRYHNGNGHSMKTFEIPACGGFMLANRTEEQLGFFPEGSCAVYFSTQEELKDKLNYYLAHETERQRIAQAGYEAARQHSYPERAKTMLAYHREIV